MTPEAPRPYLVEYHVRSSLRSYGDEAFTFRSSIAQMTLHLSEQGTGDGFRASIVVEASAHLEAERAAHDELTTVLDLLAFEMKSAAIIGYRVRTLIAGTGDVRRGIVYHAERMPRPLMVMQQYAGEVERLLKTSIPAATKNALYWLRWSYVAMSVPEAFFFTWMAIEQLAGQETVQARCSTCRTLLTCPQDARHGPHQHVTVTRKAIRALLTRHGVEVSDKALMIRHSLFHGGLGYTFEKRVILNNLVPRLRRAVERELHVRLGAQKALKLADDSARGLLAREGIYPTEYRTEFQSEVFPSDAPNVDDVMEFMEATRRGVPHPKIIDLFDAPPPW
jgi:hypothetical protein